MIIKNQQEIDDDDDDKVKKVEEEENQIYNFLVKERDDLKKTCDKIFSTYKKKKKEKESSFFWRFSREARRLKKECDKKVLEYAIAYLEVKLQKEMDDTWIHSLDSRYHPIIEKLEIKLKWMKWRIF